MNLFLNYCIKFFNYLVDFGANNDFFTHFEILSAFTTKICIKITGKVFIF